MKPHQLDQQRADMMEALYQRSGRTDGLLTGLWEEFAGDLASRFRDTDYPDLLNRVVRAMDETESVMTQKQAQQAIEVCRQVLLGVEGDGRGSSNGAADRQRQRQPRLPACYSLDGRPLDQWHPAQHHAARCCGDGGRP